MVKLSLDLIERGVIKLPDFTIRPMHYTDIDALTRIAITSFADENKAQGLTPEAFKQQIKLVTRGRMIPFRIITAFAGIRWGFFVAEVEGNVVGCGGYLGRKHMELANLMVLPEYRRQGIGQALLVKRLEHLNVLGYSRVTTTILDSNKASLANVHKQNFEVFDKYTVLETDLPLSHQAPTVSITTRPIRKDDRPSLQQIEAIITDPVSLTVDGSVTHRYFPSLGSKLMNQFRGNLQRQLVFLYDDAVLGFGRIVTNKKQTVGTVPSPILHPENAKFLPAILQTAASWLSELGKEKIQIVVSCKDEEFIRQLEQSGWNRMRTWVRLVKFFEGD